MATYGQVAALAGMPRQARLVGYALHALPAGNRIPWQRVINATGQISLRSFGLDRETEQQAHLEQEGVRFGRSGTVSLPEYQWQPAYRAGVGSRR